MAEPLKPCPLCGSDWHWNWSREPGGLVYARCNGVDCNCAVYGTDQQQVIDRINRREPGPATAKVIEDVQRQVDCGPLDDGEYIFTCLAGREARALIAEWPRPAKPEAP